MAKLTTVFRQLLLVEGRVDFLKTRFVDSGKMNEVEFNKAEQLDPTQNKVFLQWILQQFLSPHKDQLLNTPQEKVHEIFNQYSKVKNKLGEYKDILKVPNFSTLKMSVEGASNTAVKTEKNSSEDYEKLFESGGWRLYKVNSEKGACAVGAGTKWCTAAKNNNMFNHYNAVGGVYFITNGKRKFQFHSKAHQFMDEQDNYVSLTQFREICSDETFILYVLSVISGRKPYVDINKSVLYDKDDIEIILVDKAYSPKDDRYEWFSSRTPNDANLRAVFTRIDDGNYLTAFNIKYSGYEDDPNYEDDTDSGLYIFKPDDLHDLLGYNNSDIYSYLPKAIRIKNLKIGSDISTKAFYIFNSFVNDYVYGVNPESIVKNPNKHKYSQDYEDRFTNSGKYKVQVIVNDIAVYNYPSSRSYSSGWSKYPPLYKLKVYRDAVKRISGDDTIISVFKIAPKQYIVFLKDSYFNAESKSFIYIKDGEAKIMKNLDFKVASKMYDSPLYNFVRFMVANKSKFS